MDNKPTIEVKTKSIPVVFFVIDGYEIEIEKVYDALQWLERADGFGIIALIDDTRLEEILIKYGAAFRLTRGGLRRDDNFSDFCKLVAYEESL